MTTPPGQEAAAIANAIKASGVLVKVEPNDFEVIVRKMESPLVVHTEGGLISTKHRYLTGYKGLAFYTQSRDRVSLPVHTEIVEAKSISIPS